jgi:glycosyltransferase involved in cell wall biosynthesis
VAVSAASPRVSVIVPTGDRSLLLRRALWQLARQTYAEPFEVIVVDGGQRAFADRALGDAERQAGALPTSCSYVRADVGTTVGDRRNLAVEHARGELIAHFDDDDFYHPDYLAELVAWWDRSQPVDLGGMCQFWHYDVFRRRGWQTQLWNTGHPYGATFFFRKSLWRELGGFQSLQRGEDQEFFLAVERSGGRIAAVARPDLYVYMRHHRNVSGPVEAILHPQWTEATRNVLGDATGFYDDLAELVHVPGVAEEGPQFHLPKNLRAAARR